MAKIHLDKYYSPQSLADYCTQKAIEVIGIENITELVESSAGQGVFLNSFEKFLPNIPYKAYDIEPEDDRIVKQDYLELEMGYKKGRVVIGNPPFGKNTLILQFLSKDVNICDYIAYILPISQFNNNYNFYKYDLVHSEVLPEVEYSGKVVKCCFNIYKKPIKEKNKPNYKLKDVELFEYRRNERDVPDYNYEYIICSYGDIGKKQDFVGGCVKEICFKINKHKDKVLDVLENVDWRAIVPPTTTPSLPQWQVYKYLKEKIPELQ